MASRGIWKAIALGGLVAGAIDLVFATILYRANIVVILKSVAMGWLGRAALKGGPEVAALGAASHFFIMTVAAAVYVAASRFFPILVRRPVPGAIVFGSAMYFAMNYVVVPLSAAHRMPVWIWPTSYIALFGHMFLIALPIALIAKRYAPE